jgi:hypothetical protein
MTCVNKFGSINIWESNNDFLGLEGLSDLKMQLSHTNYTNQFSLFDPSNPEQNINLSPYTDDLKKLYKSIYKTIKNNIQNVSIQKQFYIHRKKWNEIFTCIGFVHI